MDQVDIVNGTLAKGFGVMGGYIAGSAAAYAMRSARMRRASSSRLRCAPCIAAGALREHPPPEGKPADASAIRSAPTTQAELKAAGLPVMDKPEPYRAGTGRRSGAHCKRITDALLDRFGIYVQPINYPTVPRGSERLRITRSLSTPSPIWTGW